MTTTLEGPHRIACLSTEAVEVLYRLGAQDRIAGISGYTVYPPEARRDKPKISGFSTARMDRLLAVRPDLVIGFSDLQRPLLDDCAAQGLPVRWFDQRSVAGIHEMIAALGELVHEVDASARLSAQLQRRQDEVATAAARLPWHPRVYFEEWDEPMICGIGWVSELIALAGGIDVFADKSRQPDARGRIVDSDAVLAADPQLIVGSWCGKRFVPERVRERAGWDRLDATLCEVKSADILSPGPSAIERGLPRLLHHIARRTGASPADIGPPPGTPEHE
jgi:iron complex transport system substrate-binding protein